MKNRFRNPLAAMLTGGVLMAGAAAADAKTDDSIHIAVVAPMSGQDAARGKEVREAANSWQAVINQEEKGIAGHRVIVDIYDDSGDPVEAVNVAQSIINGKERPAGVVGIGASGGGPAAMAYGNAEIAILTDPMSDAFLQNGPNDMTQSRDFKGVEKAYKASEWIMGPAARGTVALLSRLKKAIVDTCSLDGPTIAESIIAGIRNPGAARPATACSASKLKTELKK